MVQILAVVGELGLAVLQLSSTRTKLVGVIHPFNCYHFYFLLLLTHSKEKDQL